MSSTKSGLCGRLAYGKTRHEIVLDATGQRRSARASCLLAQRPGFHPRAPQRLIDWNTYEAIALAPRQYPSASASNSGLAL